MKRTFLYFIILFVGVAFYMMNSYEPLRCDDLIYQYYWLNERTIELQEPVDLSNRIDDFLEAFNSQKNHYVVMNGRFVVHFIVSCFCGFLGRPLFSVLNAIIYVLFFVGCVKLLNFNSIANSTTAIAIIWLGLPIQYILWYSVAFAVNYLWVSTAFIYFFILLKSILKFDSCKSLYSFVGLFLFGLVFGAMHEGFSLPLSCAIFCFIVINRNMVNRKLLFLALGLWIGTAFVVLAPGTIGRGSGSLSGVNVGDFIFMKLDVLRYSKRLYLLLLLLIVCFFLNKNRCCSFVKQNQVAILFIVIDFCFVLAIPHYSQRIEFPLELLSLLLSIDLVLNSKFINKYKMYLCIFSIMLLFAHVPQTVYYAKMTSKEYLKMMNMYLLSPNGTTHYDDIVIPKLFSSYVHRLEDGVERNFISFVYKKEMHLEK